MSKKQDSIDNLKIDNSSQALFIPSAELVVVPERQFEALDTTSRCQRRNSGLVSTQVLDSIPLHQGRGVNGSEWRRDCAQLRALYQRAREQALAKTKAERGTLPTASEEDRNRWHARCSKLVKRYYEPLLEHAYVTQLSRTTRLWWMNHHLKTKNEERQRGETPMKNEDINREQQLDLNTMLQARQDDRPDHSRVQQNFINTLASISQGTDSHSQEQYHPISQSEQVQIPCTHYAQDTQFKPQPGQNQLFQHTEPLQDELHLPYTPIEMSQLPLESYFALDFHPQCQPNPLLSPAFPLLQSTPQSAPIQALDTDEKPQQRNAENKMSALDETGQHSSFVENHGYGGAQITSDSMISQLDALLDADVPSVSVPAIQSGILDNDLEGWFNDGLAPALSAALEPSEDNSIVIDDLEDRMETPPFRLRVLCEAEEGQSSSSSSTSHED